jgi:hypothetical protein
LSTAPYHQSYILDDFIEVDSVGRYGVLPEQGSSPAPFLRRVQSGRKFIWYP